MYYFYFHLFIFCFNFPLFCFSIFFYFFNYSFLLFSSLHFVSLLFSFFLFFKFPFFYFLISFLFSHFLFLFVAYNYFLFLLFLSFSTHLFPLPFCFLPFISSYNTKHLKTPTSFSYKLRSPFIWCIQNHNLWFSLLTLPILISTGTRIDQFHLRRRTTPTSFSADKRFGLLELD